MADYILLMHDDAPGGLDWDPYLSKLREAGVFQGGSSIGEGSCARKSGEPPAPTAHITGFIRVTAPDFAHAWAYWPAIRSMRRAARWKSGNCPTGRGFE